MEEAASELRRGGVCGTRGKVGSPRMGVGVGGHVSSARCPGYARSWCFWQEADRQQNPGG